MKAKEKTINLNTTYIYALILLVIGSIIYSIWFLDLLMYFLIAGGVALINYFFLVRIEKYQEINQINVFGTLILRYLAYVVVAFLVIWLNRTSPVIEYIGISLIAGFSIIQIATVLNAITTRKGVVA